MIKRRHVIDMYVDERFCNKCGGAIVPNGIVLLSQPRQYQYQCDNPECGEIQIFLEDDRPGTLKYEFGEPEEITKGEVINVPIEGELVVSDEEEMVTTEEEVTENV